MESSSFSSSRANRAKLVQTLIAPSIIGKSCPICLDSIEPCRAAVLATCHHAFCAHCIRRWSSLNRRCPLCNSHFDSWFFRIRLPSTTFLKERLRPLVQSSRPDLESDHQPSNRRSRPAFVGGGGSRPLPWRRSFGQGHGNPLLWRASIYRTPRLQAVPFPRSSQQIISKDRGLKERVQQKLEPWIRRELQAILDDPDPTVIVHVATSLYISSLQEKCSSTSEVSRVKTDYFAQLHPFLHEWTELFWHELRCFCGESV